MLALHGAGVGKGIAIGKAFVLQRERLEIPEYVLPKDHLEEEVARFIRAVEAARRQLKDIRRQIPASAPPETAGFIDAHLLMLEDKLLAEAPIETIREKQYNAEWALNIHSDALMDVFDRMEDPYLRNKRTDIDQVVSRVQRNLLQVQDQEHAELTDQLDGHIIVANDLTPADTVMLKYHRIGAFVTNLGGPISHTAILARGLRIPAIVGLHGALRYIRNGDDLIVDGKRGVMIISPDARLLKEYRARQKAIQRRRRELQALKTSPAITRDDQRITLLANIELPGDVKGVKKVAARGVGLYRTEFLFMNRVEPPSESEQFSAYMRVIKALGNMPVTIRTLDLGADKQVDGGREGGAINPALGLRAVRLCLHDPNLFRPQLRAILRASAFGPVQLMIPMVSSLDELQQVLDLIHDTKAELKRGGHKFNNRIPIGGMIEVPAAAVSADLFATHLDFLSIGTNDLIQYTLAIDRVDDSVNYLYDPLHPSVLRLIQITLNAGRRAGIPVAMCGEMAGEVNYVRLLLGMGLRVFSMDPANLLEVKKVVRESHTERLQEMAKEVMRATSTAQVHDLVAQMNHLQ
jgi:phosphotransferase system enzyme I (PtsI)